MLSSYGAKFGVPLASEHVISGSLADDSLTHSLFSLHYYNLHHNAWVQHACMLDLPLHRSSSP
jgi:hypothetical protein